jgi:hypothetical protein
MIQKNLDQTRLKAEKSLLLASTLFPYEEWTPHGEGIFIAKSRFFGGYKEQAKLYMEIADVCNLRGNLSGAAINRGVHYSKNMVAEEATPDFNPWTPPQMAL